MIISHKYRFIFVKTLKTAGTSIEIFLSQHCGALDVLTPIKPHVEPHQPRNDEGFSNHMRASEIRALVSPEVWDGYFKFCVERNPWDKTLSYYHMKNFREGGTLSLDRYLAGDEFPLNLPRYTEPGERDHVIVDRIIRYENLSDELAEVFTELQIPFSGSLGVNAKSGYRTDRRPYCEVYSPEQAARVAEIFADECRLHNYTY